MTRKARSSDAFGEAGLVSSDIVPTAEKQRTLTSPRERILWSALGLGCVAPALGAYAGKNLVVGVATAVVVALIVATLGLAIAPTAARYGVGAGPLSRAVFGAWPAVLVHVLRYVVGVAWTAMHLAPLSNWLIKLTDASLRTFGPVIDLEWTGSEALLRGLVFAVLGLGLGWIARGRIRRSRKVARFGLMLTVAGSGALMYALWSRGLPLLPPSRPMALVRDVAPALVDACMLAWAVPEWVRYRERHSGATRPLIRAPLAALGLSFVMLVLSACSQALRGRTDASLIGDAAGTFGLGFGWAGAAVELGVLMAVLPLFGVLTASLALCSALPRFRYPYVAYATAAVATVLAFVEAPPLWIVALALPPFGSVLVDEQVVRKRTVAVLEDLYVRGPLRVSSLVATAAGCAVIVLYRDNLGPATALGTLIAMLGSTLLLARRAGSSRWRKRTKKRGGGPDDWVEPIPLGDQDWTQDEATRVTDDPRK